MSLMNESITTAVKREREEGEREREREGRERREERGGKREEGESEWRGGERWTVKYAE